MNTQMKKLICSMAMLTAFPIFSDVADFEDELASQDFGTVPILIITGVIVAVSVILWIVIKKRKK